jgi:O-antigen ligase
MAGGVLLGAVYASGSRAGAVTALFAVLVTVLLVPRLRRSLPAVVPIVGMLGILVLFFSNLSPQVAQKVRLSGSAATVAASDRQRSFAATLALKDVQARPLEGVGFAVIDDAHDIYLQLLAAGGIIMFASFLFYVAGAARIAVRLAAGPEHDLPLALGCSLMVWLLNGFVGNQVTDRYIFVPVGLLLALSLCAREPTGLASAAGGRPAPYQPGPDRLPVTAWR